MPEERIEELKKLGFNRWQKNGMDRLYISAGALGLTCTYYNTGNISRAVFGGDEISNSLARKLKAAKTYIDLANKKIVSDSATLAWAAAQKAGINASGERWDTILSF